MPEQYIHIPVVRSDSSTWGNTSTMTFTSSTVSGRWDHYVYYTIGSGDIKRVKAKRTRKHRTRRKHAQVGMEIPST